MRFFGKVIRYLQEEGLFGEGGGKRKLTGGFDLSLELFCAIYSLYFLYTTFFGLVSQETHVGFYFLRTFVISFALFKAGPRSPEHRVSLFDILFILGMTAIIIYYIVEYPKLAGTLHVDRVKASTPNPRLVHHPPLPRNGPQNGGKHHPGHRDRSAHLRLLRPLLPAGGWGHFGGFPWPASPGKHYLSRGRGLQEAL